MTIMSLQQRIHRCSHKTYMIPRDWGEVIAEVYETEEEFINKDC